MELGNEERVTLFCEKFKKTSVQKLHKAWYKVRKIQNETRQELVALFIGWGSFIFIFLGRNWVGLCSGLLLLFHIECSQRNSNLISVGIFKWLQYILCKLAFKIKIQMLQFDGIFFRGPDKVSFRIINRDNKRKEKWQAK